MTEFPDDENGDVLRRMVESGDDLSKPRMIDFSVIIPTIGDAETFCELATTANFKVRILSQPTYDGQIDITASRVMIPTYEAISGTEMLLEKLSSRFGGRNDGWGCFQVDRES